MIATKQARIQNNYLISNIFIKYKNKLVRDHNRLSLY